MDDDYTEHDLQHDLTLMVKAGLLDVRIREDGEWVYVVSDKVNSMTEEERVEAIEQMQRDYEAGLFD